METTKEAMFEAEVYRIAGEIAVKSPQSDMARAQSNFEHSLLVARKQQAKSLELRTAISLARLWRSQGKSHQARELLAPIYSWFRRVRGARFKDAKALLEVLPG